MSVASPRGMAPQPVPGRPDPRHHLSEDVLRAQAMGALPEAFALAVASHVSMCDECRAVLAAHEAVGGVVLDDLPPAAEDAETLDASLDAVMSRIGAAPRVARPTRPPREHVFPAPLRDYVGGDLDSVRWRSVGGGVRQAVLTTEKGAKARLLSIPGGVEMPEHGHRGPELTLVLAGAFRDGDETFARGDIEAAGPADQHTPVAAPGETCICLAVTDAPLRFTHLLPRLAQPFLGI